jgi:hypothetical protein
MPFFADLALAVALLIVCSFAPGFLLVRRLRWTPLEKLCGSVGLSLILVYLGAWAIYCFGRGNPQLPYRVMLAVVLVAAAAGAPDAWRLLRTFRVRQALYGFGFLVVWTGTMLAMIRVYSGAGWSGDWFEHFQRSLYFLHRFPAETVIYSNYTVPARPPMMNVLAAFFLGLTQDRFEIYQAVFAFLNILLFLPAYLLAPALGFRRRPAAVVLTALFAASPVVMQNATYSWTKALTAFYVLLAVALYLAGLRKRDSVRTAAAFVALAAGLLVHYSAGPYLAFIGLHYAVRLVRGRFRAWREAVIIAVLCGALGATWFGWSLHTYGTRVTLGSNTSITSARQYHGSNWAKIAGNVFDTIVPGWLRGQHVEWKQPNPDGRTRDDAFVFYQLNLVFAMGSIGGLVVLQLLYRAIRRWRRPAVAERTFWLAFIPFCVGAGIAAVGERDFNGVPHATLQALVVIGVTALAGHFRGMARWLRFLLLAGCAIDFYFGVYLQARVESLENTPDHIVFSDFTYRQRNFEWPDTYYSIGINSRNAWVLKHRVALDRKWLVEIPRAAGGDIYFPLRWPAWAAHMQEEINDDTVNWQGWVARHGGSVMFLGDRVAGTSGRGVDYAAIFFALLFVGLMGRMVVEAAAPARRKPGVAEARKETGGKKKRRSGQGRHNRLPPPQCLDA